MTLQEQVIRGRGANQRKDLHCLKCIIMVYELNSAANLEDFKAIVNFL